MSFTAYRSQVLRAIRNMPNLLKYTRRLGFHGWHIEDLCADAWKAGVSPVNAIIAVRTYLETLP